METSPMLHMLIVDDEALIRWSVSETLAQAGLRSQRGWQREGDTSATIVDKQRAGYSMVNSIERLEQMKGFMGGGHPEPWNCRAGLMKQTCELHCFSTLNHTVGYCYNDRRAIELLLKQAVHGFQGSRGNVD